MTVFVLIAMALILVALLWILPVLMRRKAAEAHFDLATVNASVLRDQRAELERDLRNGTLSEYEYQQARADLRRRALAEAPDARSTGAAMPAAGARKTAWVLVLGIPVAAALLYLQIGNPGALLRDPNADPTRNFSAQDVEAMVAGLAARLEQQPNDGNGWALLARSYVALQKFPDAVQAFERAAGLIKNDAALLADYAEVLAIGQNRSIEGKPLQLVEQALKLDPAQWKALAMAGAAAFDRKNYALAVDYWQKLRAIAASNVELVQGLDARIAQAQELSGGKSGSGAAKAGAVAPKPSSAGVLGRVVLSPALASRVQPGDTVFVFARAAQGPRMPLAIVRRQVKDLPFNFTLDDTHAMSPDMKLSNFADVVIGARVSKSGNAIAQSGDLQGASTPVKVGTATVEVIIDTIVP